MSPVGAFEENPAPVKARFAAAYPPAAALVAKVMEVAVPNPPATPEPDQSCNKLVVPPKTFTAVPEANWVVLYLARVSVAKMNPPLEVKTN